MGNNNRMQVKQNTNTLQRGAAISTMDNLKKHAVRHLCDHDSSYTDEADSLSVCRCPPGESGWLQQQVLERAAASSPHTAHGPRLIHSPGKIQVRDYWRAEEGALAGRLQAPETRVFWACSPSMEHTSLGQVPRECRADLLPLEGAWVGRVAAASRLLGAQNFSGTRSRWRPGRWCLAALSRSSAAIAHTWATTEGRAIPSIALVAPSVKAPRSHRKISLDPSEV